MVLPDFGPYAVPLDLPISHPMQCALCRSRSVEYVARMSFDGHSPWVGFACPSCVRRWLDGPLRRVIYAGRTVEDARAESTAGRSEIVRKASEILRKELDGG
jgi:hypothetical protein